jgi:chromosomal replication initiator protein
MNAKDAWLATLGQLQIQLNRSTYDTWLRHAELLGHEDGRFVVTVPHAYAKDWIERHLLQSMTRTLSDIFRHECEIQIIVWNPIEQESPSDEILIDPPDVALPAHLDALHPDYLFTNFVVGESNRYAYLLGQAVVDSPIGKYSPVLFYGGMGVGKTHLLQAIARRLLDQGNNVIYVTAEDFTTELVNAIRNQDNWAFRSKYRTADAVLIDDLQFIEGKTSTQNEIVAIWDALRTRRKAIIFAGDRLPVDMPKLSKDVRSRLQAGPIANIESPDVHLRCAILETKAAQRGMLLPIEVRDLIASQHNASARDLEAVIDQLHTYSQLTGQVVSMQVARMVFKTVGSSVPHNQGVDLNAVLEATASYYRLSVDDLSSRKRTKIIAQARQLAMYLAREATSASLPQIGDALGGRDHSTVMHGCARIAQVIITDPMLAQDVKNIRQMLNSNNHQQANNSIPTPREPQKIPVPRNRLSHR